MTRVEGAILSGQDLGSGGARPSGSEVSGKWKGRKEGRKESRKQSKKNKEVGTPIPH